MRSRSVSAEVLASLTLFSVSVFVLPASAADKGKEKELSADGIRSQLQWEDKVVGPQTGKQIDHAKIAALQEQARRDEASRPKTAPRKAARPEGVAAPASSTLPTMDIEKAAPAGSVKLPPKKSAAHAAAPKQHDAVDDFLAMAGNDQPATHPPGNSKKARGAGNK